MKKNIVLAAFVALFAFAVSASAQNGNLSGKWSLDVAKSELGQQAAMIKSQTVTITQAGTSFKVATATERNAPPAGAPAGGGGGGMGAGAPGAGGPPPGGGGGGGMGGGGGANEQSYTTDGKEVSTERQTQNGAITIKTKAEQTGNKVVVTTVSPGQNGDVTTTSTYDMAADGKTLTVTRVNPRGTTKSVYNKAS